MDELFPLVYAELRRAADHLLGREFEAHTLQPTALVHEVYLKLVKGGAPDATSRAHFLGIAARAMRQILVDHAPGHTGGSVLFRLAGAATALDAPVVPDRLRGGDEVCLSGDVLFAGSIGRTDLPGGSTAAMRRSLRDKILPLDDTTMVLPGHGPATTIGRERRTNPYLLDIDVW